MAIWHFQVGIIPEGADAPLDTPDGLDESGSWRGIEPPDWDWITAGLLQATKVQWSEEINIWGIESMVQLSVIRQNMNIASAFLRIDVRHDSRELLDKLLDKFSQAKLQLAFTSSDLSPPLLSAVIERLRKSRPFKLFCASDEVRERAWQELARRK